MAAPLATCTKEEQRSVIRFLSSEGLKHIEIHRRMKVQCGDACLSLHQVYEWTGKFMNGISSVKDSPRPGQAHRVVTPEGIAAVEAIVKENRRVTVNEIASHLDINIETRAVMKSPPPLARRGAEGNSRHSDRNISLFHSWSG